MIGYTDAWTKTRINLGNTTWSFINGTIIALVSPRFKRRTMFLTGAIGMLVVYVSWTIAMQRAELALETGIPNKAAGIAVIFFVFFYSPWYNIGNNALAYSKIPIFPGSDLYNINDEQHIWSRSSLTPNAPEELPLSNSLYAALVSSLFTSILSVWTMLDGNISSCTM